MPPRALRFLPLLLLPLALLTACDTLEHEQPATPEPQQESFGGLTFTPAPRGALLHLPGLSDKDSGLTQRMTNGEGEGTAYGCIVTTLLPDTSEYAYRHRPFYVGFPENKIREAKGETEMIALYFTEKNAPARAKRRGDSGVVRVARCLVPKAKGVRTMLEEHLRSFGEGSWLGARSAAPVPPLVPPPSGVFATPGQGRQSNYYTCGSVVELWICMKNPDTGEYYNCTFIGYECTQWVWVDDGDPYGGGGGGNSWNGDDANACQPNPDGTFSNLCVDGEVAGVEASEGKATTACAAKGFPNGVTDCRTILDAIKQLLLHTNTTCQTLGNNAYVRYMDGQFNTQAGTGFVYDAAYVPPSGGSIDLAYTKPSVPGSSSPTTGITYITQYFFTTNIPQRVILAHEEWHHLGYDEAGASSKDHLCW